MNWWGDELDLNTFQANNFLRPDHDDSTSFTIAIYRNVVTFPCLQKL